MNGGFAADLDLVVARTRNPRYRELTDPGHRDYDARFVPIVRAMAREPWPPPPAPPPPAQTADQFRNAASCPHRERIPEGERVGCGCRFRCAAGHGNGPGGATNVLNCWACQIAPRRHWPA